MNCCDTKRHLEPFLDGELTVEVNLEVLRHLGLCPGCSSLFEGEKQLLGVVVANCPGAAPTSLKTRICAGLDGECGKALTFRILVPMIAAGLIVGLVAWSIGQAPGPEKRLDVALVAQSSVDHHEAARAEKVEEGLRICPNCPDDEASKRLVEYFKEKGHPACVHSLNAMGFKFVSGTVDAKGRCWTTQECPKGTRISHCCFPAPNFDHAQMQEIKPGVWMSRTTINERPIMVFYARGHVCLFVTDTAPMADQLLATLR